jgi:Tfp pilus assembly protein PilF
MRRGRKAHYQLGRALLRAGRREEAMQEFCTALKQDPEYVDVTQRGKQ